MEFKDLAELTNLALKQSAEDVDMELFNAKLVELFPESEGYSIKRFYPKDEHVFVIYGKETWQIRVKTDKSADESSVEFDISFFRVIFWPVFSEI